MKKTLFITGTYRSGTTLLDKLLNQHPSLVVGSQPMSLLFFLAKQSFLDEKNIQQSYPIEHNFLEDRYSPADFTNYLLQKQFGPEFVARVLSSSIAYNGMLTKGFPDYCLQQIENGTQYTGAFKDLYKQLTASLATYLEPRSDYSYVGVKEILGEEYFQYFLGLGTKILHIVRDPRDVVSSLSGKEGKKFMGGARPILYTIRLWRKSVAHLLHFSSDPNYLPIRYEDLVNQPRSVLEKISNFLAIDLFSSEIFSGELIDQTRNVWEGNSSYETYSSISKNSIGKFKLNLPKNVTQYIEALCWPEMRSLGYAPVYDRVEPVDWKNLIVNERIENDRFSPDYSFSPSNLTAEAGRIENIGKEKLPESEVRSWFLFSDVKQRLANA